MNPRLTVALAEWAETAEPGEAVGYFVGKNFSDKAPACQEFRRLEKQGRVIHAGMKRVGEGVCIWFAAKPKHKPRPDRAPLPCGQVRSDHAKAAREQLTKDRIALTAQRLMAGYKQIDIAEEFGVHPRTVGKYADKARRMGMVE
jgi:hypothetical protein